MPRPRTLKLTDACSVAREAESLGLSHKVPKSAVISILHITIILSVITITTVRGKLEGIGHIYDKLKIRGSEFRAQGCLEFRVSTYPICTLKCP